MSLFLPSFALLFILFLGATGNIGDTEDEDMDLFGRSWNPVDIETSKRAGIRNFNVAKLRDFRRFLQKFELFMSQPEETNDFDFLPKAIPRIEIQNIQTLEAPEVARSSQRGLSYGRG